MTSLRCFLCCAWIALGVVSPLKSDDPPPPSITSRHLNITIYPSDLALFKDLRHVTLHEGGNKILINQFPASFIDSSLLLRTLDDTPLIFMGITFQNSRLSFDSLLTRFIGQSVFLLPENPKGSPSKVQLLAVDSQKAIIEHQGLITNVPRARIAFAYTPEDFDSEGRLTVRVKSPRTYVCPLECTYLTRGLSWKASYTVEIAPKRQRLNMIGWVTISNKSGTNIKSAHVQLASHGTFKKSKSDALYHKPHFYPLQETISLRQNIDKRITFFHVAQISATPFLRVHIPCNPKKYIGEQALKLDTQLWFKIQNTANNRLGFPLPPGRVEVYANDQKGHIRFVGSVQTPHRGVQDWIAVPVEASKVLDASLSQKDFRALGKNHVTSGYRLNVTNHRPYPVTFQVLQNLPPHTEVTESSHPYTLEGSTLMWTLTLAANRGEALRYRVHTHSKG